MKCLLQAFLMELFKKLFVLDRGISQEVGLIERVNESYLACPTLEMQNTFNALVSSILQLYSSAAVYNNYQFQCKSYQDLNAWLSVKNLI